MRNLIINSWIGLKFPPKQKSQIIFRNYNSYGNKKQQISKNFSLIFLTFAFKVVLNQPAHQV